MKLYRLSLSTATGILTLIAYMLIVQSNTSLTKWESVAAYDAQSQSRESHTTLFEQVSNEITSTNTYTVYLPLVSVCGSGADCFELNDDFDHAATIELNVKYTNINFAPSPGQTIDNDFFKTHVTRGLTVTCETLDLSQGTDTNMIVYDNNRNALAGNDDVDLAHGDLRSKVTVIINFDGFLYVLVGQGFAVPPSQASQYTYSLQCTTGG